MNRSERGAQSHAAGIAAEETAARWYQNQGAAILARRWRCKEGEIDLIIRDGDTVVFVEVKKRKAAISEDPITPRQWQRLENAAEMYILIAETGNAPLRFDVVIIDAKGAVEVIKNARS
ncbi:MAG: YraN family protein [Pikeienuella sp.]